MRGESSVNRILAIFVIAILLLFATGCVSSIDHLQDTARILAGEGVTQVQFTGYDGWACSEDDWYHDAFTGIRNGVQVRGVVCGGLNKGYTVRYH
jgi:hypothetical protein